MEKGNKGATKSGTKLTLFSKYIGIPGIFQHLFLHLEVRHEDEK